MKNKILKNTEDIKSLIDVYVGIIKNSNKFEPHFENPLFDTLLSEIHTYRHTVDEVDIYGAVWTKEGLIYKAKYVKENEWELI